MPSSAARSDARSVRSPSATSTRACQGTSRSRAALRDRQRTWWPAASSRGASRPPMYPVAPVTKHRITAECALWRGFEAICFFLVALPRVGGYVDTFWGPDFAQLERDDPEIAHVLRDELAR